MNKAGRIIRSNDNLRKGCFIVLGNPRGGTSVVSGMLRYIGVFMGARLDQGNQEDLEIRDIGSEILESREKKFGFLRRRRSIRKFREIQAQRSSMHDVWGFKDPICIEYLDDIIDHVDGPRFVIVYRDPVATAIHEESVGIDYSSALSNAVSRITMMSEVEVQSTAPTVVLSYEKLVRHPTDAIRLLSNFCFGFCTNDLLSFAQRYVAAEKNDANWEELI